MTLSAHQKTLLAVGGICIGLCSGCITISPEGSSMSWKSLTKPRVEQAAFEEEMAEPLPEPKDPNSLRIAYGKLMEETGQTGEARSQYAAVIQEEPKNVDAILGLGRLDELSGDLVSAEKHFQKAVSVAPDYPLAHYSLGQFYAKRKNWLAATESLTQAMLADPHEPQYRYALAVSLARQGEIDAALPHFIRTVGDAEAHYNIGLILQEQGQLDGAERQFSIALTKDPTLTQAKRWLAHLRGEPETPVAQGSTAPTKVESPVVPTAHTEPATAAVTQTRVTRSNLENLPPPRHLTPQQREQMQNQQPTTSR